MAITIDDGELVRQDPNDIRVYKVDWDARNLAAAVSISTSSFTITVVSGLNTTPLTKDQESILAGNRKTQLRLQGGTVGTTYQIDNQILTNESPAQTKNRKFLLLIEDL